MAKTAKKDPALTPEEKLAQALIPESEQPYQIPENWCWVILRSISFHISDGSHNPPKDSGEGVPLLSATNIHDRIIDFEQTARWITNEEWMLENERTRIEAGDILLTIVATIGRVAVVTTEQPFALQRSVATIKPKINAQYLSYYFESPYVQTFMNTNAKGTAQKGFYLNSLENLFCAIPPLAEQQRIVNRIESLFAKLDEAKEKAQAVVDGFEDRKAAILHKAFTGELTGEWRKQNHIDNSKWEIKPLSSITYNHDSKRIPLSKEERANLDRKYDYYGASGVIDQVDRYLFDGKFLLIGEDGANLVTRSKPIAFIAEGQYWVNNHAHILSTTDEILMEFLCYYINSISLLPYVTGSAQPKMTQAKMNTIPIPVPTIKEQKEIVQVLNNLVDKMSQAMEAAEQVLDQIDAMKKSILARAFRGELGTNDPADESAEELLKRIL